MRRLLTLALLCFALSVSADETFPRPDWKDVLSPIASPDAVPGGTLVFCAYQSPKSLNYYVSNDVLSQHIFTLCYESLLGLDPMTAEFIPGLACRWTLSDDKRVFTFEIDPAAVWSDGRPVTAADVKWTFDKVMAPASETGRFKVALETFTNTPPRILGPRTIRFVANEAHWRNLLALGDFCILPSHVYSNADFNKINFEFPVVSGPYRLGTFRENIELRMERRADWWQRRRPSTAHTLNFQTVSYRFFSEQENALESLRKGDIDLLAVYMSRLWNNETSGDRFDRNWIAKQRVRNHEPRGFQGFAMNLRRPPFDDLRVRQALALLLDRDRMNRTLMYNAYFLQRSYFEDLYGKTNACPNVLTPFEPEKAHVLLRGAGWLPNPQTGMLEKAGKRLRFTFLTNDAASDKFLALYSEDLKKAGIELKIERKDAAGWARDLETFNFDMTWVSWTGSLFKDPEPMWSSREADRPTGNNVVGFRDARVDALIEKQKTLFDIQARNQVCREIDSILCEHTPYILLWNIDATRLLYWNKFGMPRTVLGRFGDERVVLSYWWYDADSAAELKAARAAGSALPKRPEFVDFDAAYRP